MGRTCSIRRCMRTEYKNYYELLKGRKCLRGMVVDGFTELKRVNVFWGAVYGV